MKIINKSKQEDLEKRISKLKNLDYKKLKARVIEIQEKLHLNAREMSDVLGVQRQSYHSFTNSGEDRKSLPLAQLWNLAQFTGYTIEQVIGVASLDKEEKGDSTGDALEAAKQRIAELEESLRECRAFNQVLREKK